MFLCISMNIGRYWKTLPRTAIHLTCVSPYLSITLINAGLLRLAKQWWQCNFCYFLLKFFIHVLCFVITTHCVYEASYHKNNLLVLSLCQCHIWVGKQNQLLLLPTPYKWAAETFRYMAGYAEVKRSMRKDVENRIHLCFPSMCCNLHDFLMAVPSPKWKKKRVFKKIIWVFFPSIRLLA